MEKVPFVPMRTYKKRLLHMGIKGENTEHSPNFSTEYSYTFALDWTHWCQRLSTNNFSFGILKHQHSDITTYFCFHA